MRCTACKIEVPYDVDYAEDLDCLFCGKSVKPTAEDFLSYSSLGIAREVRSPQVKLTQLVDLTTEQRGISIVEAGTGIGKSFAYLLPSILSGRRTLITTAKKSLQSQLFEKDLPFLQDELRKRKIYFKYAIAYGKSNYICEREAFQSPKRERDAWTAFKSSNAPWMWDTLEDHKKNSKHRKKLEVLHYDSSKSAEGCVGRTCKHFENGCSYTEDRRAMLEASVVVTNHWLFGYHLKLLRAMDYPLLGSFENIVVDEAHKLDDGLRAAFTESISDQKLNKLISSFENVVLCDGREFPDKKTLLSDWRQLFQTAAAKADAKDSSVTSFGPEAQALLNTLTLAVVKLSSGSYCKECIGASPSIAPGTLTNYLPANGPLESDVPFDTAMSDEVRAKWIAYRRVYEELKDITKLIKNAMSQQVNANFVTYIERKPSNNQISIAPVELGQYLNTVHATNPPVSIHYLSATLAVNGAMDVFAKRMGLSLTDKHINTAMFGSAFDLKSQATLYIARSIPEPSRDLGKEEYRSKVSEHILTLTEANGGNAFVLFTARDEMLDAYERIQAHSSHPLLVQDGTSAADLLKQYRATPNAVLLGMKSFWEGVDVAGDKLSLVIIVKLPFPGRTDPIVNARRAKAGNNWFNYVDVPDMIFDLRQGVGRLIRTTTDTGMVAILDARLLSKPYGKGVVRSTGFTQAHTELQKACAALQAYVANRI